MSRRSSWVGLAVLAAAVAVVLVVMRHGGSGGVGESAETVTDVAVHVGRVERATLHRTVTAYGTVGPAPSGEAGPPAGVVIGSSGSGILVGIDCVEGQRVARGDTLFRLDPRRAEVDLQRAEQALAFAEKTVTRQQELLKAGGTSEKALQVAEQQRDAAHNELSAARTRLALLRITAPLSGTVVRIDAKLGQAVEANTVLGEIVDLGRLVLSAGVPSREAATVAVGQDVELQSVPRLRGKVLYVGADIDSATDTVPVRVSLPGDAAFRPGQLVAVGIVTEERRCLAIPLDALVTRAGEGTWIMRVEGDRAIRTPVTAGLRERGLVEIEGEGVSEGMPIVTDDAYSLPAETRIRVIGR